MAQAACGPLEDAERNDHEQWMLRRGATGESEARTREDVSTRTMQRASVQVIRGAVRRYVDSFSGDSGRRKVNREKK